MADFIGGLVQGGECRCQLLKIVHRDVSLSLIG